MSQDSEFSQKTLEYVRQTAPIVEWAEKRAAEDKALATKVAQVTPRVADLLVQGRFISPSFKDDAVEKLASHEGTLEILTNLLQLLDARKTAGSIGQADSDPAKQASVNGGPTVGRYNGRRPSDDIWESRVAG